LINLGNGTTIFASTPGTLKTAGNVFIALGTVPTTATVRAGTTPTPNPDISGSTTPLLITYGTTTNTAGSITTSAGDTFNSKGRNISFNTQISNGPLQITLGTGVTITADPPSSAGLNVASVSVASPMAIAAASPMSSPTLAPITGFNSALPNFSVAGVSAANGAANNALSNAAIASEGNFNAAASNNAVNSVTATNRLSGSAVVNETVSGSGSASGSVSNLTHQVLDSGIQLLAPDHNTIVDTPYGPVSVAAGAVALLVSFEKGLAVYDLHDSHKGAIVVGGGNQTTSLVPGRSALLTRSSVNSFEEVNPTQLVGYRQVTSHAVDSQTKLFQAEFEIMSVVRGLKPLTTMVTANNPKNRKTVANILKTAAILMQLTQGQEAYRPYCAPQQTAYAPNLNQ
jgi:hypothetical protein